MADFKAIQQLDLNLLKIFESLYVEQNMTRTAEALHITPSAVSHAVKRLRSALQDPLFQRSQNKMLPTPACQRMAPLIIDNLTRLRQILQQWGEFEPETSQHHFRIGMHDALEASILPALAKQLAQQAPNASFSSIKVDRTHLARDLAAGHIDMAFDVALPIRAPVLHEKLMDDAFCVLLRKEHPLSARLVKSSYFEAAHISVSHRASGPAVEDMWLQEQGKARQISIRCQNYYAAKAIVQDSDSLLTVPRSLATRLLETDLTIAPLPFNMPALSTHLYWHQNTELDGALLWLRKVLRKLFEDQLN